jgi:hypothetical protein
MSPAGFLLLKFHIVPATILDMTGTPNNFPARDPAIGRISGAALVISAPANSDTTVLIKFLLKY